MADLPPELDPNPKGLDSNPPGADQPRVRQGDDSSPAIDRLVPGGELHARVLAYLLQRLDASEREMEKFYSRWEVQEKRVQAYIHHEEYERILASMNEAGKSPKVVSVTVPYIFATISTICTYLMQVFGGRNPIFQIGTHKAESAQGARSLEAYIQYNADHVRLLRHLFQYFYDGEVYGLQVLRTRWTVTKAMRSKIVQAPKKFLGISLPGQYEPQKVRESTTVFEGTEAVSQDPFFFFPDPRVPMADVNRKGEYVFWRTFEARHTMLSAEKDGLLKWVNHVPTAAPREGKQRSARGLRSGGDARPGENMRGSPGRTHTQFDQCSIMIIPAELGLGTGDQPERWIFGIGNRGQIVQAERLDLDHDMHPVVVGEPYSMGYGFGSSGSVDYLGPMQETISWFLNSHVHNVRTALNNMFIVDPSMVEMQDLRNPEPGKTIRLKKAAWGRDVRQAIQQLQVQDITRSHVADLGLMTKLGDMISGISDNVRGQQDQGGRKTATESRLSAEAAASRLMSHARFISTQSMVDLTQQMSLNAQQFLTQEFEFAVLGGKALTAPIRVGPQSITGDFHYPVSDGSLPLDRVALMDVWKEVFMAIAQDPQLRQGFDVMEIFSFIAELGGATDIERFKVQGGMGMPGVVPQIQVAPPQEPGAGMPSNVVPIGGGMPR